MSRKKTPVTFSAAVQEFEDASPWLGPQHAPAVVSLRAMAVQLDAGDMAPALLGQFGLAFRSLSKERPVESGVDPLTVALQEARAS
ncbi:hypothetical protein [Ornithinimicrobium sp. W1665]|uniref:hypothetical protein n=1 Tax=Ornithinimicrobium sp. W1665 TaxID=3416666 RepID=UPI003CEEFE64